MYFTSKLLVNDAMVTALFIIVSFCFFLLTEIRKLLIISKVKFYNYLQGLLVNIFPVFFLKF